jgi:DNA (cytosine-5)-methyltransferase 1
MLGERPHTDKPFRYLSVCSGMEAASVAWHPLGWEPAGFSEIEPFPAAILAHRFPNTPNHGDLTQHATWPIEPNSIDLLVGGTPCQSFSVAGLRKGLADPRGNLALTFLALADRIKPRWIIWENVPGVLSSGGGRDFGSFLGALVELGYGFAYRILDAQYFGVPQRRRRVFVVACAGDWRAPAEVLSLREGLLGYLETGGKKRKGVAPDAGAGAEAGCWWDGGQVSQTLDAVLQKGQPIAIQGTIIGRGDKAGPQGTGATEGGPMFTLTKTDIHGVAHTMPGTVAPTIGASGPPYSRTGNERVEAEALAVTFQPGNLRREAGADPSFTTTTTLKASAGDQTPHVATPMAVRRLTPVECERLQGFPDNWSRIPWKGKPETDCPDGPRYKACGNSMAVPCMFWIGQRINNVHNELYGKNTRGDETGKEGANGEKED